MELLKKNGQFIDPESENVLHPKLAERLVRQDGKWIFKVTDKVFLSQKRYKAGSACKGSCKGRN